MKNELSVVVVETDPTHTALIVESLAVAGDFNVLVLAGANDLARTIRELKPDVVLIDIANPSRDALEEMALASGPKERTAAMFGDQSDDGMARAAIEAGASA
jgi:response regulator NasT